MYMVTNYPYITNYKPRVMVAKRRGRVGREKHLCLLLGHQYGNLHL